MLSNLPEFGGSGVCYAKPLFQPLVLAVGNLAHYVSADNEAVADLRQLFRLADACGYADWLVFDASVVRGLAYYTGKVCRGQGSGMFTSSVVSSPELMVLLRADCVGRAAGVLLQ